MISIFKPKSATLVNFFLFRDKYKKGGECRSSCSHKKMWRVQKQSFAYVLQNSCSYIRVGKYLGLVSLFNKVAGLCKISRTPLFTENLRWLLILFLILLTKIVKLHKRTKFFIKDFSVKMLTNVSVFSVCIKSL